ncbi:hypothetical protein B0H14DRAFT_3169388 [Mycena olivaceomarginata]|nr:hypothetical protein B0H14DRAFT_3169388 [Mycena olivaceomarginata]
MPCEGKSGGGCSKSCTSFRPKKSGKVDENSKCKCSHRKKVHKDSTIRDVLAKYGVNKLGNTPTDLEARTESYSGFRPKGATSGTPGPKKAKGASSKKNTSEAAKMVKISGVQVITGGIDPGEGDLRDDHCPTPAQVEKLLKYHLAVSKPGGDGSLEFGLDWSQSQIDEWLRELLPLLFEFLDSRYPDAKPPALHWALLGKDQRTLFVMERETITGAELDQAKGPYSAEIQGPCVAYWWVAIERVRAGEELVSESECEEDPKPARRRHQSKGKGKAVKKPMSESEEDTSSRASESEADDLESAADKITFQGIYYFQTTTLISQEIPPPSKFHASSLKRSASPFGSFNPERSRKRVRSASLQSHHSVTSSNGETVSPGASPHLRPASSSFQYDPTTITSACASGSVSTWTPSWLSSTSSSPGSSTSVPHPAAAISAPQSTGAASTGSITHPILASASASTSISAPVIAIVKSSAGAGFSPGRRPLTGHSVKNYVPPPPREGLNVPKAAHNPWAFYGLPPIHTSRCSALLGATAVLSSFVDFSHGVWIAFNLDDVATSIGALLTTCRLGLANSPRAQAGCVGAGCRSLKKRPEQHARLASSLRMACDWGNLALHQAQGPVWESHVHPLNARKMESAVLLDLPP